MQPFDVNQLPGIMKREDVDSAKLPLLKPSLTNERYSLTVRAFGTVAVCPLVKEHRLVILPVSETHVDVYCLNGCSARAVCEAIQVKVP